MMLAATRMRPILGSILPLSAAMPAPLSSRQRLLRTTAIAALVASAAAGLLYAADRFGPSRQARHFINVLEGPAATAGVRRAHSHGVCFSGWFEPGPDLARLANGNTFSTPRLPVLGRLSVGGGGPVVAEASARVRSLALQITAPDGQQWRMAMNSFPFFALPTAEAFLEQVRAQQPDPVTGQPDSATLAALQQRYPSARAFARWAASAPWTDSWATTDYHSVHSYLLVDAQGRQRPVRWTFVPIAAATDMTVQQRRAAAPDYLGTELEQRLASGPVRWHMQLQLAGPGDDINDPSTPWPDSRERRRAGTLWLEHMQPQQGNACAAVNFDPTVVPQGVRLSDDPILAVRSAVYAQSWNRRQREQALGQSGATP